MGTTINAVAGFFADLTGALSTDTREPAETTVAILVAGLIIEQGLSKLSCSREGMDSLEHAITMGIRHGLFGADATNYDSLLDSLKSIDKSIECVAAQGA